MVPSFIRTAVPYLVGVLLYWVGQWLFMLTGSEVDLTEVTEPVTQLITVSLSGIYYLVIRFLERNHGEVWGWFLGLPDQPRYAGENAPTGS